MDILPLTGLWLVSLSSPAPQFPQGALPAFESHQTIELPGTTETRGVSPINQVQTPQHLGRVRPIEGPVLYARDVEIPATAAGKWGELVIERTKLAQAWWDEKPVGTTESYLSEAVFPIPDPLKPGRHRLTVLVDNTPALRPVRSESHQFSDNTQTNWNGMLGKIELRLSDPVDFSKPSAYPVSEYNAFDIIVPVRNRTDSPADVRIAVSGESFNHSGASHRLEPAFATETVAPGAQIVRLRVPLGEETKSWDEFTPALYRLHVSLESVGLKTEQVVETAYRLFSTEGTHFTINGRRTFLRGKHDACVFPLTGHPPMDLDGWLAYLKTCKEWGINHVRFHTWVPPEAAFQAADRLGMYLQPELPFWGEVTAPVQEWMRTSAKEVVTAYANHPSFVMFTLGNELYGDHALLNSVVSDLRLLDPTRLFADGSNNFLWKPEIQPTNHFMVSAKIVRPGTEEPLPIRGSFCFADDRERRFGLVQWSDGGTRFDFEAALRGLPMPLVSHEIGQYSMYPDFNDIQRYTGVVRGTNLEFFRSRADAKGVLKLAPAFAEASGRLAAELYREEIEASLRTASMGGFQLLDLQDFPGQGTALVGVLNAFMEPKGVITAKEWRSFCSPTVPLARMERRIWTSGEAFSAALEVSHFGQKNLSGTTCHWSILDRTGTLLASGSTIPTNIPSGGLFALGTASLILPEVSEPKDLQLSVRVETDSDAWEQDWTFWLYPKTNDTRVPGGVLLVRALDGAALDALAQGGRVLLMPPKGNWAETVSGAYATDFWNWRMFNNPPGTLGLLIDATHPAFSGFPTKTYTDRRWTAIATASTPVLLGEHSDSFTIPIRVIDNFERNEPLGLLFETSVGNGRLLVCAADLLSLDDRPEARSLLQSLLSYCASDKFDPTRAISAEALRALLAPSLSLATTVTVSSAHSVAWEPLTSAAALTDGDINTKWLPRKEDPSPWLIVDLEKAMPVRAVDVRWVDTETTPFYEIDSSADGLEWVAETKVPPKPYDAVHHLQIHAPSTRMIRFRIDKSTTREGFGIREIRIPEVN